MLLFDREGLQRRNRWVILVAIVARVSWEFDGKLGPFRNNNTPNR